jgi:hypothetical protein
LCNGVGSTSRLSSRRECTQGDKRHGDACEIGSLFQRTASTSSLRSFRPRRGGMRNCFATGKPCPSRPPHSPCYAHSLVNRSRCSRRTRCSTRSGAPVRHGLGIANRNQRASHGARRRCRKPRFIETVSRRGYRFIANPSASASLPGTAQSSCFAETNHPRGHDRPIK